ncbi:MAG: sensor histidine kinase [Sphingobacterium sp.]|uniref:sensor histidine kinase n=1 Tax=Sphingobacterium sp. JB170 TaxID=1434842 RepID=UPI00097ED1AC|nr:histidine kinase [Sphingobacterium sp. JB170]SJN29505.1 Autolysin sensor kinase [Sphingobacterium sp. JB170]
MIFKLSTKNRLIHVSSWTICIIYFVLSYFLLWWDLGSKNISPYEPIVGALSITACCYLIFSTLQYYLPRKNQYLKITLICLVLTLMSIGLSIFFLNQFFDDLSLSHFYQVLPHRFIINFLLLLCVIIINIFWNIQEEYEENKKRKDESERILRDAELYNLRQQLQPHFLFNSLNSIIALIGVKPDEAKNMTFQLSDFLRGTMRKDDKQLISLKDELAHLRLYLDIEKVRFGHRLSTTFHIQEETDHNKVPAMIIQPVLENAIKYGLYNVIGDVEIRIQIYVENYLLFIIITNPYDSDQFETKRGTGFGLSSIRRRLFLLYGRTDLLETAMKNNIFTTTLKIPQYD